MNQKKTVYGIIDILEVPLPHEHEIDVSKDYYAYGEPKVSYLPKGFYKCSYCGAISDLFHTTCPQCGGPISKGDLLNGN